MNAAKNPALGMLHMPYQQWTTMYGLREALKAGTIFPDLDKPFYMGGGCAGGR